MIWKEQVAIFFCVAIIFDVPQKSEADQNPCSDDCDRNTQTCEETSGGFQCQCRPGYYLSGDTCVDSSTFLATMEIETVNGTSAEFSEDLTNRESERFIMLESDICNMVDGIYADTLTDYYGCTVIKFDNGSIIADINLLFDPETNVTDQILQEELEKEIERTGGNLSDGSSVFTVSNYQVIPTNECELDIDDCSSLATCTDLGSNGYECSCNDGYTDVENYPVGTYCQPVTSNASSTTTGTAFTQSTLGQPVDNNILSTPAVIGISVGSVILIVVIVLVVVLICELKQRPPPSGKVNPSTDQDGDHENPTYDHAEAWQ